jgi:hypothetical protein
MPTFKMPDMKEDYFIGKVRVAVLDVDKDKSTTIRDIQEFELALRGQYPDFQRFILKNLFLKNTRIEICRPDDYA